MGAIRISIVIFQKAVASLDLAWDKKKSHAGHRKLAVLGKLQHAAARGHKL